MSVLKAIMEHIIQEVNIFFSFTWRDWSATVIPGSIIALGVMSRSPEPLSTLLSKYLFLMLWLSSYIYFFDLSNQITGVDEDKINKPDRPIASGKVTLHGAKARWWFALSLFLVMGLVDSETLMLPTINWIATTAFLVLTRWGNHFIGKNMFAMPAGAWSIITASWGVVASPGMRVPEERYVGAIMVWAGCLVNIQDLRDAKGDRAVGRKTMPLVFGDKGSRHIIAFVLMPVAVGALIWGGIFRLAPYTLAVMVSLNHRHVELSLTLPDNNLHFLPLYDLF